MDRPTRRLAEIPAATRARIIHLRQNTDMTVEQIMAAVGGMSFNRVRRVLSEAGIAGRRQYVPQHSIDMLQAVALAERGLNDVEISRLIGVPVRKFSHMLDLAVAFGHGMNKPPKTVRACLSCRGKFASDGAHHRVCSECKDLLSWQDSAPDPALAGLRIRG